MDEQKREEEKSIAFYRFNQTSRNEILTYNVLLERFQPIEILYAPTSYEKAFSWYTPVAGLADSSFAPIEGSILYLCHPESARKLLDGNAFCFCLVAASDLKECSFIEEGEYKSRVLVFKETERFYYYNTLLQTIFSSELLWLQNMDSLVYRKRSLRELCNLAATTMENFICITDTGYNLIDYSTEFPPQLEEHTNLLKTGCLGSDAIEYLQRNILPKSKKSGFEIIVAAPNERRPYPLLHCPIYIDGFYLFHLVMECAQGDFPALFDQFKAFSQRAYSLVVDYWKHTVNLEAPWHRMLISLINNENLSDDYLKLQLSLTDIPQAKQFRLLQYRFSEGSGNQERHKVIKAASQLNNKKNYAFVFHGQLFVLLYSTENTGSELCGPAVVESAKHCVCDQFGLIAGVSEVFYDIHDIRGAFKQTEIAHHFAKAYMKEYAMIYDTAQLSTIPFEYVLKYYLIEGDCDKALIKHSFDNCILSRIVRADRKDGTDKAGLLWVYLICDRNATEAANRIHIHRNTILYHIKRLETQFGLDFDNPFLKERIEFDYCHLILQGDI